jgi:hypothetical protein
VDEEISRLRAAGHPLRLRMLSLLTGAELSAAEVARELDLINLRSWYDTPEGEAAEPVSLSETSVPAALHHIDYHRQMRIPAGYLTSGYAQDRLPVVVSSSRLYLPPERPSQNSHVAATYGAPPAERSTPTPSLLLPERSNLLGDSRSLGFPRTELLPRIRVGCQVRGRHAADLAPEDTAHVREDVERAGRLGSLDAGHLSEVLENDRGSGFEREAHGFDRLGGVGERFDNRRIAETRDVARHLALKFRHRLCKQTSCGTSGGGGAGVADAEAGHGVSLGKPVQEDGSLPHSRQ